MSMTEGNSASTALSLSCFGCAQQSKVGLIFKSSLFPSYFFLPENAYCSQSAPLFGKHFSKDYKLTKILTKMIVYLKKLIELFQQYTLFI